MNLIEQIKVNDVSIDGYQGTYYDENSEYVQVTTDVDGKILEGIKTDGTKHIGGDLIVDGSIYIDSFNVDQIIEDILERVDEILEPAEETLSYFESIDNPEWLQVTTDAQDRIIAGVRKDGSVYIGKIDGVASEEFVKEQIDAKKPFTGKKIIAIGDSHTRRWGDWMPTLIEKTGAIHNATIQNQVLNAYYREEYELQFSSLCAQAQKLIELKNSNNPYIPDVIIMENCHYSDKSDGINADPIIPSALIKYPTTFPNITSARNEWNVNKQTIINDYLSSAAPRTIIKIPYGQISKKLKFSLSGTVTAGNIKLTINGTDFVTQLTAGMTLEEVVGAMNSWAYGDYIDWTNGSLESDTLVLVYTGSKTEPSVSIVFEDTDSCGVILDSITQEGSQGYLIEYYKGFDTTGWSNPDNWFEVSGYAPAYGWLKGFYEMIQSNFPNTLIISWTVGNYNLSQSSYKTNGIFDYNKFLTEDQNWIKYGVEAMNIFKEVAELYNIKCVDVQSLCGITPFNMFDGGFYNENDVHPKKNGYIRWIETLIDNL